MKFNVNDSVKVKLTEAGLEELRRQHDELYKRVPLVGQYRAPKVDAEGYSEFQLWYLMQHFGHLFHLGAYLPFDPEIEIPT